MAALTTAVVFGMITPTTTAAPGTPDVDPTTHVITLITGDVVSAVQSPDGRISASVTSGDRAGHVLQTIREQVYLFPKQAAPHITSGQVDLELFNLSRLIRDGYDDRARDTVPLIVSHGGFLAGSTAVRELPSIGATAVNESKRDAAAFWHDLTASGTKVWLDRKARTSLDVSVPQIGAPAAWQAGYTGKGVTVAVLDTGIAAGHPDLAGKVLAAQDFTESASGTEDKQGHGTHVASTIVGTGSASGGKFKGVAPDGKLVVGKVLDDDGSGWYSGIIAGMEWAATRAPIVSMSLGGDEASDGTDPLSQAVNRLSASTGALFVVAAGNSGQGKERISTPAAADAALTVGAVSKQDELASFSSSGPRIGDNLVKPEITAPGVDIVAARVKGSDAGDHDPVDDNYARLSGTSMATPHVSGAAALLRQQHPDWSGQQLKTALTSTAKPLADLTPFQAGAGRSTWVARRSSGSARRQVCSTSATSRARTARSPR
jgi:subtilisin family serine protease